MDLTLVIWLNLEGLEVKRVRVRARARVRVRVQPVSPCWQLMSDRHLSGTRPFTVSSFFPRRESQNS